MGHIQKRTYKSARTGKTSASWQARYTAPDGRERTKRFERKVDAEGWLKANEGDVARGAWIDPKTGQVTLRTFANEWLAQRNDLRPTTRSKYRRLLDRHIFPLLGNVSMSKLSPATVRRWHSELSQRHRSTAAGAYRLLATIFNTAVEDEVVLRSPCRVKKAAEEASAERPTATVAEVGAAIEACVPRFRLGVLLAVWCQLRRGEVLGLQRGDIDEIHSTIKVARTWVQVSDGDAVVSPPKTKAGERTVKVPPNVMPSLIEHLTRFTNESAQSWVFPGTAGKPVSPRTLERAWVKARQAINRPDLHFHDLRHSGLTWTAGLGATTAELMHRGGHKSPAAALRYQHAQLDRDAALAHALGDLASENVVALRRTKDGRSSDSVGTKSTADLEQPQRDSNPCRHLERVVS